MQQLVTVIGEDKDFREWDEVYHISTWSEVVAGFHEAGAMDIQPYRIPARWEVGKDWIGVLRSAIRWFAATLLFLTSATLLGYSPWLG